MFRSSVLKLDIIFVCFISSPGDEFIATRLIHPGSKNPQELFLALPRKAILPKKWSKLTNSGTATNLIREKLFAGVTATTVCHEGYGIMREITINDIPIMFLNKPLAAGDTIAVSPFAYQQHKLPPWNTFPAQFGKFLFENQDIETSLRVTNPMLDASAGDPDQGTGSIVDSFAFDFMMWYC